MGIKPIKILWQSDSPLLPTGYSYVVRNILTRLSKDPDFEVVAVAANAFQGIPLKKATLEDGTELNFPILPQGREPYNRDMIIPYILKHKPDVYCFLQDTFMYADPFINGLPWLATLDFPCKTIFYYPSDGDPFPAGCEPILKKMTVPVAMSKFAQEQVKKEFNIDAEYIPHGVNTEDFKPLNIPKEELRTKTTCVMIDKNNALISFKGILKNKFVAFSVFRNQGRKMPDLQLKAWKEFSKDKEDVIMLMHTDPMDRTAVFDMRLFINQHKLNNKVVFTGMQFHTPFTTEQLNEFYNCADIYFQSTSGEGWGLTTTESMSCEIPILLTNYTTTDEIVTKHNAGLAVPYISTLTGTYNVERALMNIDKAVESLQIMYDDWKCGGKKLKEWGKNGRKACQEEYEWDKVVDTYWKPLLKKMVEE